MMINVALTYSKDPESSLDDDTPIPLIIDGFSPLLTLLIIDSFDTHKEERFDNFLEEHQDKGPFHLILD